MHFILNIIFGLIAGFLTDYVLARMGVSDPVKVLVAVLVGVVVFLADLASQIH